MSKSVASESEDDHQTLHTSRKRGGDDEGEEDGDEIIEGVEEPNSTTLTTVETAPAATDQFMHTPEFRRHFVDFVPVDALMALRSATKGWNAAADALIDEGVESRELMVHDGKDFSSDEAYAKWERRQLVTRDLIFLLHITKVGDRACKFTNLVVVDIPEGVHTIGEAAFACCRKLTTVSFPTTLKSIGWHAFLECTSLDNVDLLHTNLQELGAEAFFFCSELKTMTIPDSLQTLGLNVFRDCSKLVPENIDVSYNNNGNQVDTTSETVAYLRSQQLLAANPHTPAATDQFMHSHEFRRHFLELVPGDALVNLRLATKGWNAATEEVIDEERRVYGSRWE